MFCLPPIPLIAMMETAQLLMLAGFIMLGWVMARRQIRRRKKSRIDNREANKAIKRLQSSTPTALPLADAPAETQRWQVALFDLQRELKAELDTRIVIVQTLLKQVDQRIDQLSSLPSSSGSTSLAPRSILGEHRQRIAEMVSGGHTAEEIAEATGLSLGDVELTIATMPPP